MRIGGLDASKLRMFGPLDRPDDLRHVLGHNLAEVRHVERAVRSQDVDHLLNQGTKAVNTGGGLHHLGHGVG